DGEDLAVPGGGVPEGGPSAASEGGDDGWGVGFAWRGVRGPQVVQDACVLGWGGPGGQGVDAGRGRGHGVNVWWQAGQVTVRVVSGSSSGSCSGNVGRSPAL